MIKFVDRETGKKGARAIRNLIPKRASGKRCYSQLERVWLRREESWVRVWTEKLRGVRDRRPIYTARRLGTKKYLTSNSLVIGSPFGMGN